MTTIASSIPGRIRMRSKLLRNKEKRKTLLERLRTIEGVMRLEENPTAGSIVVYYDAQQIECEHMEAEVEMELDRVLNETPSTVRVHLNRYSKYAMASSLGASLTLLAVRSKKGHALTGAIFLASLAVHLAIHRKRLFT